jgi:hypothetical protein
MKIVMYYGDPEYAAKQFFYLVPNVSLKAWKLKIKLKLFF